ncbi:hypothetical protein INT43_005810 [Umbelopsis isabellina]|uniref:Galactose oxidase n=1 Tax=Mortierella isabellina TaxID=91625 RepID=A0A8H7PIR4_MORIS|nr:hypothetical protein INT43_005810 [Umbelopsis isabellina]
MRAHLIALAATSFLVQSAIAIVPSPSRWASQCSAVASTIYCYGGIFTTPEANFPQSDTWSIDVSKDFSLASASWTNVTENGDFVTTPTGFGIMTPLNDGVSFLVNGGLSTPFNQSEVNQTTVFNTATKTWSTVNSTGITQARQHQAVTDASGRIWFWGGVSDYQTGYNNLSYWGAFTTLDLGSTLWSSTSGEAGNAPARVGHTMTITNSGLIYIIGGLAATKETYLDAQGRLQWLLQSVSMSDIPVYDTRSGVWSEITGVGQIPISRNIHSATLGSDGATIFVFGGASEANLSSVYDDLYTFDTSKSSWTQINAPNGPSPRAGHCAVQVNNTMFILFGYDFTLASLSDIHALDTVNMKWVDTFSANGYPLISNSSSSKNTTTCTDPCSCHGDCPASSGLGTGAIVGIAVGCGVGAIGASVLLFFCLRRRKQKQPNYEHPSGPVMKDTYDERPLPPVHTESQPSESLFNSGSQSENKSSYYGQSGQELRSSMMGSIATDSTPPYSAPFAAQPPHSHGTTFVSKPDAAEVPNFTLQATKPNEDDD